MEFLDKNPDIIEELFPILIEYSKDHCEIKNILMASVIGEFDDKEWIEKKFNEVNSPVVKNFFNIMINAVDDNVDESMFVMSIKDKSILLSILIDYIDSHEKSKTFFVLNTLDNFNFKDWQWIMDKNLNPVVLGFVNIFMIGRGIGKMIKGN